MTMRTVFLRPTRTALTDMTTRHVRLVFVRSVCYPSVSVVVGQCLFSPTEHIKSALVEGWNV